MFVVFVGLAVLSAPRLYKARTIGNSTEKMVNMDDMEKVSKAGNVIDQMERDKVGGKEQQSM